MKRLSPGEDGDKIVQGNDRSPGNSGATTGPHSHYH